MPRPKKTTGDPIGWDIRWTPGDQNDIDFALIKLEDFEQLIICREGGSQTGKKLHYHIYALTLRSETWLRQWSSDMTGGKGNPFYSIRKAHEGTIGYVVKEGDVVLRHGWTQQFLTEMLSKSQEYKRNLEAQRKRVQRSQENTLGRIMKVVAEGVSSHSQPEEVMKKLLYEYHENQIRFPSRSTLENAVMTILYKHSPGWVESYYCKNLSL